MDMGMYLLRRAANTHRNEVLTRGGDGGSILKKDPVQGCVKRETCLLELLQQVMGERER